MRYCWCVCIVLCFFMTIAMVASTDAELLVKADHYYQMNNMEEAIVCYQAISNPTSYEYHMLARCFVALADFPRAVACLLKADKGVSFVGYQQNQYIWAALKKIMDNTSEPFAFVSYNSWLTGIRYLLYHTPLVIWQLLFLVCWVLLSVSIWHCWFYEKSYTITKIILLVFCLSFTVLSGMHLYMRWRDFHDNRAVVMCDASLYIGPHEQYHVIASVAKMTIVDIEDSCSSWCRVRTTMGQKGWMMQDVLAVAR